MTAAPNEAAPPNRAPDRDHIVEVNGTTLHRCEWGESGAPLVIMTHGAYDHARMCDGIALALAERGFECWAVDMRGHGDSGRLFQGQTFQSMMLDLALLANERAGPVGLVGHSMGGNVVLQSAAVWPDVIDWVISLDGIGPPPAEFENQPPLPEMVAGCFDQLLKTKSRPPRVFADQAAMVAQRQKMNTRGPAAWMQHMVTHGSVAVAGGYSWKWDPLFNTWLPTGFSPKIIDAYFRRTTVPTLVLSGAEEELWSDTPLAEVEARVSQIADSRVIEVPDAGHYVHLENEAFVVEAMTAFIAEVAQ